MIERGIGQSVEHFCPVAVDGRHDSRKNQFGELNVQQAWLIEAQFVDDVQQRQSG